MTHDVGGGFGAKIFPYGEHAVVLLAARLLGRPVNWTATRNEVFLADAQARDHVTEAELALDQDGKFLAMRVSTMAGMGAYIQLFAPFIPTDAAGLHGVPYVIPAIHARVRGVYTNTVPVDAYRGAGKPEAAYVTERLVDAAAREMSIPPEVLRRRNFIQPDQMPYQTATGVEIDSGDFASLFEQGLELADRDGFAARRTASIERGMARGLGIGVYLEKTFGALGEYARMEVDPAGQVRVHLGTQSQGQGHETTFAQVVSERLGIPFEAVQLLYQDSETLPGGGGTMGSRSMVSGGTVVHRAADDLVSKGKELAATALDDQPDHIDFTDGHFHLRDTNRSVSLFDLAADPDHGFEGEGSCAEFPATFPNGVHICEVEIDPATGKISIERFSAVNDCGVVVNPMIVEGQVQGGVVQGLGQALLEHCVYDPVSGQLLTGSFMDYGLPRADMIPDIAVDQREIPTVNNDMGFKGVGEAGATGAPPALVNAVLNGLADLGVTDLDMPLWPEKIWQAIQAAKAA